MMGKSRYAGPALLAAILALLGGHAMADQSAGDAPAGTIERGEKTGKERLSGKAADEQRVNDCKVPAEKRGASKRPSACARAESAQ